MIDRLVNLIDRRLEALGGKISGIAIPRNIFSECAGRSKEFAPERCMLEDDYLTRYGFTHENLFDVSLVFGENSFQFF